MKLAVMRDAEISPDGLYRYSLTRRWAPGDTVTWVLLNPSTADANTDDQTVRQVMTFSRLWGYGKALVVNLFALRSSMPSGLLLRDDPVGPENDYHLSGALSSAKLVVGGWGAQPVAKIRARYFMSLAAEQHVQVWALGTTKDGAPRHPCRLGHTTALVPLQNPYEDEESHG